MFQNAMLGMVAAWKPVCLATTDEEREAICGLRQRICVGEQNGPELVAPHTPMVACTASRTTIQTPAGSTPALTNPLKPRFA